MFTYVNMPLIRVTPEFKSFMENKKKRGESIERTILNSISPPIDQKLKKIFDAQDKRRKEAREKQEGRKK